MFTDRQFRLARHWSNDELRRISPFIKGDIVNVSGWKDEDKQGGHYRDYFPAAARYSVTNYGGYRGFQDNDGELLLDLTVALPAELNARFDAVFNHTTLEHIFEVRVAFKNLCALSSDLVVIVVPFAQMQHEHENILDFWRFTPTCLRAMFEENDMKVVYESANDHHNAACYIFMVGSKNPDKWKNIFPATAELSAVASDIGINWRGRAKRMLRRLRPRTN